MKKKHQSIIRALQRTPSVIERFWTSVDSRDSADGCWEWLGTVKPGNSPMFRFGAFSIIASHVAWFVTTGELPAGGRVRQRCQNPACVRPSHLAWSVGRRTESVLEMQSDGYVQLSGLPFEPAERDAKEPRVFRLISPSEEAAVRPGGQRTASALSRDAIAAA